jgi:signal transduction histidine kinase
MSKIGETYLLIPLKGGKSFTQDDGNKKIYSDILNKMTKSKLFEYDESSFLKIRMAHIITKKDWSSPYGIFYVIEINPNVTGTIRNILIINIIFVLIYIILYFYYNVTIKKNFVKPLQKITEEISNSTPIVDQKSSNVLEIERLRNSYLEHLENIKLRDLLKEVFIAQENERERISKNLHDTILQDLSYILIELSRNGQKTLGDILKNSIKNLRTLLIETDMFKLKKFGLEAFLNEFMEEMMYRFQSIDFFHEIDLSNVDLDEEKNLLIARIVKELLLNAAVHSGGKNIFMAVKRIDNEIVITVKDNGVGFDLDKGFNKKGHLGLKLIRERVYILKGNLKISTKDGTEVVIRIPIDEDIKDS